MNLFKKLLQNFKSKKQKDERIYILDACALKTRKSIQLIEEASKIILLTGSIRELDKWKKEKSLYGNNICAISRKSREDEKSEKYICVAGYEKYSYQDDNIIDYCRKHKEVIILTSDNNLCNMAKAYNISYIFLDENGQEEKKLKNSQNNKNGLQNVKGVIYKNKSLYLKEDVKDIIYLVIREHKVLKNISELKLQTGDIIYRIKYINSKILLNQYKIEVITKSNYAKHCISMEFDDGNIEKIKESHLPIEVKNEVIYLLKEVIEPKHEEKLEVKESLKQEESEICFSNNYIYAINQKNYHIQLYLEREGKIISLNSYKEGDIIYQLKYNYNVNKNNFRVCIYKIILNNKKYKAEKIDEYLICYINDIYKLHFSEEMKDKINSFYIGHIDY